LHNPPWIVNPDLAGSLGGEELLQLEEVPAYQREDDGSVGARYHGLYAGEVAEGIEVDPEVWNSGPDEQSLILARHKAPDAEVWIERSFLADPACQATMGKSRQEADALDRDLDQAFWQQAQADFQKLTGTVIRLTSAVKALRGAVSGSVDLPPGHYKVLGTSDRKFANQLAPFTVALETPSETVLVNPNKIPYTDDSQQKEAVAKGLANKLSAAEIRAPFPGLAIIRDYLPSSEWLTDANVNYVTPDQMGVAFVRNRKPQDWETDDARNDNPDLFAVGAGTPGLQIGDDIFIQENYLGIGTEYHEAFHLLSKPAVRTTFGFDFNEGVTEYLTRKLLQLLGKDKVVRDPAQYQAQHAGVSELIQHHAATDQDLADAYFNGNLQPLFTSAARLGPGFSLQGYAACLTSSHHLGAELVLAQAAAAAKQQ
jgi:hypothetical protein